MFGPTVNYTRENYGTTTKKLAFESDKSFSGATANLHQESPDMKSDHSLLYHLLFTVSGIP